MTGFFEYDRTSRLVIGLACDRSMRIPISFMSSTAFCPASVKPRGFFDAGFPFGSAAPVANSLLSL